MYDDYLILKALLSVYHDIKVDDTDITSGGLKLKQKSLTEAFIDGLIISPYKIKNPLLKMIDDGLVKPYSSPVSLKPTATTLKTTFAPDFAPDGSPAAEDDELDYDTRQNYKDELGPDWIFRAEKKRLM